MFLHALLQRACEALRIWQAALPPGHQHIADADRRARRLQQAKQQACNTGSIHDLACRVLLSPSPRTESFDSPQHVDWVAVLLAAVP